MISKLSEYEYQSGVALESSEDYLHLREYCACREWKAEWA